MNEIEFAGMIARIEDGKALFKRMFNVQKLDIRDTFLLVLTDTPECIRYGIKYLPNFIGYYRRNVYVLLNDASYEEQFKQKGGKVNICSNSELESLAVYFNMFYKKNVLDLRVIFLTEKDVFGLSVRELLKKGEFTLEEYVAISLYHLKELGSV